ncbi:sperm-associated antigen 16 protein [Hypomesus transpacificus]|uniref:sperm-associated antigen 16 protein n=1 Tax=Hypomesus transpacificus TaxID=137520 RepID=UPI001F084440|nr:sperm-associated antigen 16 protein [Hypomesus transpacificus]
MSETSETEHECVDGPYYLEDVSLQEDSEDDYQYEEIIPDAEKNLVEGEEDFDAIVRAMRNGSSSTTDDAESRVDSTAKQTFSHLPEVVNNFLCNFLVRRGLSKTMDCFQVEWHEIGQKDLLKTQLVELVPDAYTHNQLLEKELKDVLSERNNYIQAAFKASETLVKLKKERDFHRQQYQRVAEEKNRLVDCMKRLKQHYASYKPALKQLNDRYQEALKQRMMIGLERDKAFRQTHSLVATLDAQSTSASRAANRDSDPTKSTAQNHPDDSEFLVSSRVNPYLPRIKALTITETKTSDFHLTNSIKAHTLPISFLALHPHKFILASSSDDQLWKLWGMPVGEMIMTGEGHSDWLSGCSFHPNGGSLATTSGDTTVRIWDFSRGRCTLTLEGHSHATWGCSFHSCGDFVASCSMDNTAKIWDLQSERCRDTLRGHVDSVNSVSFLPYSNTLLTCSADKTLSLWDTRVSLCAQTLYGHRHSCNHATFNALGDTVASCDSFGVVKLWDVRKVATLVTVDTGPHSSNQVAFSPSGRMLAIASNDCSVKMVELASSQVSSLQGHDDTVQSVTFDHRGENLLSAGSDGTIFVWS